MIPNKHYNDLFDYSYSGMELYFVDGLIVIGDVAKGSPADLIGLKENDVVVGINKSFNQNLQDYKAELQVAGKKVKIVILRQEQLHEYEFKTKSIL